LSHKLKEKVMLNCKRCASNSYSTLPGHQGQQK
jgi:ribosomal protein L33